jgi:hypothetical protein
MAITAALALTGSFCSSDERTNDGKDASTDADSDTDSDSDSDTDTDTDTNMFADNMCPGLVQSFIWIANTAESTLSKVCTVNGEEVARYRTCPLSSCDPSRTSVNLHGDMVVTNRDPGGPSSVTKFAADIVDCVDNNDNGQIDTSFGPTEVLAWGEYECMLWNTPLTTGSTSVGARATAWDGSEDPETGEGGYVWIGAMTNKTIYKLNGDTGLIEGSTPTSLGHYGGVMDGKGNFWTIAMGCTIGLCSVERIDMTTLDSDVFDVHCGYGISADAQGRIWTSGLGCVSRLDPTTGVNDWVAEAGFNRGIAVDGQGSVWVANTNGDLVHINESDLSQVARFPVGVADMVGVAVDHEGYVWTVSQGGNTAYKVDPDSYAIVDVPIGQGPYTYSDMTGMQLKNVIIPE